MKTYIIAGMGFDVGQDFARATVDTPVELAEKEYAGGPRWVIGYIAGDPLSRLGFLRGGSSGRVRVRVDRSGVRQAQEAAP